MNSFQDLPYTDGMLPGANSQDKPRNRRNVSKASSDSNLTDKEIS